MKASEFKKLLQGVREAGEYMRGERLPARVTVVGASTVKELRKSLHLTQVEFARLLKCCGRWRRGKRVAISAFLRHVPGKCRRR